DCALKRAAELAACGSHAGIQSVHGNAEELCDLLDWPILNDTKDESVSLDLAQALTELLHEGGRPFSNQAFVRISGEVSLFPREGVMHPEPLLAPMVLGDAKGDSVDPRRERRAPLEFGELVMDDDEDV